MTGNLSFVNSPLGIMRRKWEANIMTGIRELDSEDGKVDGIGSGSFLRLEPSGSTTGEIFNILRTCLIICSLSALDC